MKQTILVSTLIVSALLIGSLALAGPGGSGFGKGDCKGGKGGAMSSEQHEERMGRKLAMMTTLLDLSAEQQTQIEALFNQQYLEKQKVREQMEANRDAMQQAKTAIPFNEADFRAKAAVQAELKTDMMVAHAKLKQQIHAVLTPQQQKKADDLGDMMGDERGKGRHHGGDRF
ncbi:MAG: Spy/CpxP family protein refolding chaperone [Desulfuromonadales bacterium]|nr:Spy/CpxP family protein refolding chaperone [Desulfuromonadales bacterium]